MSELQARGNEMHHSGPPSAENEVELCDMG